MEEDCADEGSRLRELIGMGGLTKVRIYWKREN
jgi:hypothetical protein